LWKEEDEENETEWKYKMPMGQSSLLDRMCGKNFHFILCIDLKQGLMHIHIITKTLNVIQSLSEQLYINFMVFMAVGGALL